MRDAHQQFAGLADVEAGFEDRIEGLFLLVGRNGGEQLGVPDLDPPFIERQFDRVREACKRETAIQLCARPTQATNGLGAIIVTGGKDANSGIGLLGFGRIVAHIIFVDGSFERFLVGHLTDDDGYFRFGSKGFERGLVPAPTYDNLVCVIRRRCRPHQHGLDHSPKAKGFDKFVELLPVEIAAWIVTGSDAREWDHGSPGGAR